MNYLEIIRLTAPEWLLVVTAFIVLGVDLMSDAGESLAGRMRRSAWLTITGCAAALAWTLAMPLQGTLPGGFFTSSPITVWVKQVILILTLGTALISAQGRFTPHAGEYFALLLFATLGMLFLVSSENLLMIFLALELTSLSLYILVAFDKSKIQSAEAALKYFLFGGVAAAFTLFGLSLIYGLTGEIELGAIAANLRGHTGDSLFLAALVMTIIGFGFKVAVVPFHLWAPDAYQGAPTPSAALVASGSKVASFFVLARLMSLAFAGAEGGGEWRQFAPGWVPVLAVCAAFSMVLGNFAAIIQSSVKRLLGYSAIAHAGYMILGVIVTSQAGSDSRALAPLLYYVATYAVTTVGAFAVVMLVEQDTGSDQLTAFAGLGQRAPVASFCMMIFMLSLAGIPPLAGFFGKFYLFTATVGVAPRSLGLLWLVVLAIATSAVSLYYYLQILKQIYVAPAAQPDRKLDSPQSLTAAIALAAAAVIVLGCVPGLVLAKLAPAVPLAAQTVP